MEIVDYFVKTVYSPATEFWLDLKTKNKFCPIESPLSPIRKMFAETGSRDGDERKTSMGMWIPFKELWR